MNMKKLNRAVTLAFGSESWIRTYYDGQGRFFRIMLRSYYTDVDGVTRRETFHRVSHEAFKTYRQVRTFCHQLTRPTHQYQKTPYIVS